jgi:hypothetical protein
MHKRNRMRECSWVNTSTVASHPVVCGSFRGSGMCHFLLSYLYPSTIDPRYMHYVFLNLLDFSGVLAAMGSVL